MLIAVVADLHGNLPATEALDADLKRRKPDDVWCLGDTVGKGPCSDATYDWAVKNCSIILRGNWEDGVSGKLFHNDAFYYRQLGDDRMRAMTDLPLEFSYTLSGQRIRLIHGRPLMKPLLQIQDDAEAFAQLFEPDFDILCYADAHRQGLRMLPGGKRVINTGSVGNGLSLPMVQYLLLSGDQDDASAPLDIQFVTLPYDRERAVSLARAADGLHRADAFINEVLTGVYSRK